VKPTKTPLVGEGKEVDPLSQAEEPEDPKRDLLDRREGGAE
jgi:hypothetical protein